MHWDASECFLSSSRFFPSLLCGLSTNIYELIGLRFVQALGGGGLVPSVTGIVSDLYGPERDRPIGLMTSIYPLGALIGPAVGGVIVTYFSWRLIFFIDRKSTRLN